MTRRYKRYSEPFRLQVVSEYEAGEDISSLRKKYGITGMVTINRWIKKYGKGVFRHKTIRIQTAEEANRVRELEKQVQELQSALGQLTLEKLKLESIVEVLEAEAPGGVKKNERPSWNSSAPKSSSKDPLE
jgi:transposase-like protein